MNLSEIGSFLKELRKEKNLTQEQLAEKLGITNKTISRWETGTYLPSVEMLQILSEFYDVSINEILCGKKLTTNEYKEAAEENLKSAIEKSSFSLKEKIDFYKKKWLKEHIAFMVILGIIYIFICVIVFLYKNPALIGIMPTCFFIIHCIRYNCMMAYVDRKVYK